MKNETISFLCGDKLLELSYIQEITLSNIYGKNKWTLILGIKKEELAITIMVLNTESNASLL